MKKGNELTGDPKCWLCAKVNKPGKIYGPNICFDCKPAYRQSKFVFVRATQAELDELFPPIIRPLETLELGKENNEQDGYMPRL